MSRTGMNLQDMFLNYIRKERIIVTVSLLSGVKVTGRIKGFDNFAIFLKNTSDELIYKHAIASIVPDKEIRILRDVEERSSTHA